MKRIRLVFRLLALAGRLTLFVLAIRKLIKPIWPYARPIYQMRRELSGISKELSRIQHVVSTNGSRAPQTSVDQPGHR